MMAKPQKRLPVHAAGRVFGTENPGAAVEGPPSLRLSKDIELVCDSSLIGIRWPGCRSQYDSGSTQHKEHESNDQNESKYAAADVHVDLQIVRLSGHWNIKRTQQSVRYRTYMRLPKTKFPTPRGASCTAVLWLSASCAIIAVDPSNVPSPLSGYAARAFPRAAE